MMNDREQISTQDGRPVTLRPLTPRDRIHVAWLLCRLSDVAWWQRYMSRRPRSPELIAAETERIAGGGQAQRAVLLAVAPHRYGEQVLAIAELVWAEGSDTGEMAVVVGDGEQRRGIGRALVRRLAAVAQERGLTRLRIDTLAENRGMLALTEAIGAPRTVQRALDEVRIVLDLRRLPDAERRSPAL